MTSPLEENPIILQKIGLFIVLFNNIESSVNTEFFFLVNQSDKNTRPLLDFLVSQIISIKLQLLQNFTGSSLYEEVKELNDFRNHISHGLYGKDLKGLISNAKRNRSGNYSTIPLSEEILDQFIERERKVLEKFHKLILKRIGKEEKA